MLLLLVAAFCAAREGISQGRNPDSLKRVAFSAKQDTGSAHALCELAIIYRNKGKQDSARRCGEQALEISRRAKYPKIEALALYQLGILASNRGEYVDAMEKFSNAGDIYKTVGDKKGYASVLSAMGGQKTLMGDLPGALDYYHRSLKIKEELGDSAILASTLSNIGITYNSLGEPEQALSYYQRGLRLNLKYGKAHFAVNDYYNIGNAYANLNQDSVAMMYAERSARIADSLELPESLMYAYGLMGRLEIEFGRFTEAIGHLKQAIALAEALDDQRHLAYDYKLLGEAYEKTGNRQNAKELYFKAYNIGRSIGAMEVVSELAQVLSMFYEKQGDPVRALAYYKEHIQARDSLKNSEKREEILRKEMNFEFEKRQAVAKAEAEQKEALRRADQKRKDEIVEEDRKRKMLVIYAGSAVLALVLVFLFVSLRQKSLIASQKKEVERQRDMVEEQKGIIEEKNKDITDSINYAQRIQQAILPDPGSLNALLPESFILFRPRDIVSGDFYWFTEKNGKKLVAAVDCTGHGVPGAFMSMIGNAFLKEIVNGKGITKPSEILSGLRHMVIEALKQKGQSGEQQDGMDISLCCFYEANGAMKLEWAGANNPLWIVRGNECIEASPDKRPIGYFRGQGLPFTNHVIGLQEGDMLYAFTDGFADQFGGPKGKKFKYKPFQELLVSVSGLPAEQQRERIAKAFDDWKGALGQVDDVLVIGVKV